MNSYVQTKATGFFSECYTLQLRGGRLRREVVCPLALRGFPRERVGPLEGPGSLTGHHAGWVSAEVHHRKPLRRHHRKKGLGAVMKTWCGEGEGENYRDSTLIERVRHVVTRRACEKRKQAKPFK